MIYLDVPYFHFQQRFTNFSNDNGHFPIACLLLYLVKANYLAYPPWYILACYVITYERQKPISSHNMRNISQDEHIIIENVNIIACNHVQSLIFDEESTKI